MGFICTLETNTFLLGRFWDFKATPGPFADSVDQDQATQNVQSDLSSTLSEKKLILQEFVHF